MKRFKIPFIALAAALMFTACGESSSSDAFDSDNLKGKYSVDLIPYLKDKTKGEEDDGLGTSIAKGITAMAMSSIKMELSFYENNKGVMFVDGGLINLLSASSGDMKKTVEFVYKVENDSILYIKKDGEEGFNRWATIQKYSDSYDYLKLLVVEEGQDDMIFNLNRISK